jgi:glycosyltransferase involved in cell wall biosynthesis
VELLLAQCDVFVQPCVWEEAFGLVVTEALASERPVIASRVGGIPEIITHEKDGLLVGAGDVAALAATLHRVFSDPMEARRLGAEGRRTVVARFRLADAVEHTLDWCEESART